MADELTLSASFKFVKNSTDFSLSVAGLKVTVTGKRFVHLRQLVGTTEEALDLGDIATGGYFFAVNRDPTNYVEIRSGTGATDLVKLKAGEVAMFRMSSDAAAPFVIANTAAVDLEYVLVED